MSWKTVKGFSDKIGVSQPEYWEIVTSWLGLRKEQHNSFYAMFFEDFVNGEDLRPGFVRQTVGTAGTINYLTLEEYFPGEFKFTVSISREYFDPNTKYLTIRNEITQIPNGSRWNISVSRKQKTSILSLLFGSQVYINLDQMFHSHIHFTEVD